MSFDQLNQPARAAILKTLDDAGVKDFDKARAAMKHLLDKGLVKRTNDELGLVTNGREVGLAEGVAEFLKTRDGKAFMPPQPRDREIKTDTSKIRANRAIAAFRRGEQTDLVAARFSPKAPR
jgi:hypothetical protein